MSLSTATQPAFSQQMLSHVVQGVEQGLPLGRLLGFKKSELEAAYMVGHGFYQQGRYADAAQIFGLLASHDHLDRRYVNAFAASLQMTGEYVNAISLYGAATMMDATDPAPGLHIGECLIALGLTDEALSTLQSVIRMCGGDANHAKLRARATALLTLLQSPPGDTAAKEVQ